MKTTLDKFGRVVLPKRIREDLGLQPGDELALEERADTVVLTPLRDEDDLVMENGVLVWNGEATGDIAVSIRSVRNQRVAKLRGDA